MDRVPTARSEEDLVEALPRMAGTCSRGRLLVVEDGELIGLVSPTDAARVADTAELASARRSPELS